MKQQREHWGSRLGLILATAGSAIGLGSLWRFPYLTGENGGGLFVILYIVFTIFIGLPVFIAEILMGRTSQEGPVMAFKNLSKPNSSWHLVGWLSVFTSFIILSYYAVIAGWSLNYMFMSLTQFYQGKSAQEIIEVFEIVYRSPQMNVFWQAIFVALTGIVVFMGVRKGIEKWSRILMPLLFLILIGLFIYSMTLPGAGEALKFIFYPDLSRFQITAVLEALGMAFFALSVGLGILITYGSYMRRDDDLPKTAFMIAAMDIGASLLASMVIFPIVFSFGFQPAEGTGLVFKVLPVLFSKLPATLILSTIFFLLVVFTALTSTISLLEAIVANCIDVFEWPRKKAVLICSISVFIFGIPTAVSGTGAIFPNWKMVYGKDFFGTINYLTGSWCLPIAALLTSFFIGWAFDKETRLKEFIQGTKFAWLYYPWLFLIRFVVPFCIIFIILHQSGII